MFRKNVVSIDESLDFRATLVSSDLDSATSIVQIAPRFCSNGFLPQTKFTAQKDLLFNEYNSFYSPRSTRLNYDYSFLRELGIPKEISRVLPCYLTSNENYISSGGGQFTIPIDKKIYFWIKYVHGQPPSDAEGWTELKKFEEATTRIEYGESVATSRPASFSGPNNTEIFYSVNIPFLALTSSKDKLDITYYDIGDIKYLSSDFAIAGEEYIFDLDMLSSYYD